MVKKFKDKLNGERIILKRTKPTLQMAKIMFKVVDENREHLKPWFPWEKLTLKVKDSLKYLIDKEKKTKLGQKIEYGVYAGGKYIGNISIFDLDPKKKSAEIGYWVSSSFTRKGYITEAVKILEKESFENLDLNRIQIKCDERNKPSSGVAKKCGYKFEGKYREDSFNEHFNDFRNTLVYSKLKSEYEKI